MWKIVSAVAAAASIAAAISLFPGFSPTVEASTPEITGQMRVMPSGPACSQQAWPHLQPECLNGAPTRQVRVISLYSK
jgi:hypothetical protein